VPSFVHDVGDLVHNMAPGALPRKALPAHLPSVTMRLETPLLYFHLPKGTPAAKVDVDVSFQGGWLSQFYPNAQAEAPGVKEIYTKKGLPNGETVGSLHWKGLTVGGHKSGPACNDPVWTAPRRARSDAVTTRAGEHEQFLFYRGIGHVESPVTVTRHGSQVSLRASQPMGRAWLVEVGKDGRAAYSSTASLATGANFVLPDEAGPVSSLRKEMKAALVEQGLFGDEAQAMLDAWQLSYFQSPGLRVFYIVPQAWTDKVLPLKVSSKHPVQIKRVMIGRVELVSPALRNAMNAYKRGDTGAYQRLGRFRGALIGELQAHP